MIIPIIEYFLRKFFFMSKENNIVEYGPSELGTKEYWDSLYDRENKNFQENGDIGEIWYLFF